MRIDLRTGRPCRNPRTTRRDLKAEDAEIRSDINARALGMTTRIMNGVLLAAMFRHRQGSPARRALAER